MRNGEWRNLVSVVGRILLASLFVFSQGAWAGRDVKAQDKPKLAQNAAIQQTGAKPSPVTTPAKPETEESQAETSEKSSAEEKPSGDGNHEGIKVHGHWTIEVRNPDGSFVSHREFENSLQQGSGPVGLTGVLGHLNTAGYWSVFLVASPNCGVVQGISFYSCQIFEPSVTGGSVQPPVSNNLGVNAPIGGATLTLQGSVQVPASPASVQITSVQTGIALCPPSSSPQACVASALAPSQIITSANLKIPIAVQANQIVQVSVVISFS
jgi:hypothetical protein